MTAKVAQLAEAICMAVATRRRRLLGSVSSPQATARLAASAAGLRAANDIRDRSNGNRALALIGFDVTC